MKRILATLLAFLLFVSNPLFAFSWEGAAEKVARSVERVVISDAAGQVEGYCSAFSINDKKDYFLSAAHCAGILQVGGHPAYIIYLDQASDLMVVVVPASGKVPAIHVSGKVMQKGTPIAALGFGYGVQDALLKTGTVSNPDLMDPEIGEHFLFSDFSFIPGMSGGPVFDQDGKLVSIVQMGNYYSGLGRTAGEITLKVGSYFE